MSGKDALDFVAAGASAVSLGTVLFTDPFAPGRVRDELEREAGSRGTALQRRWAESHSDRPPNGSRQQSRQQKKACKSAKTLRA